MKKVLVLFFLAGFFWCAPFSAKAAEKITDFNSDITINADGTITVIETITADVEHDQINHGIYRDLIERYQGPDKDHYYQVGYKVLSVKRDGKSEPYHLSTAGSALRIYVGDEDVLAPIGLNTYELTYQASGLMRYFDESDELYWNVTGNGWSFPIEKAQARVTVPWTRSLTEPFYTNMDFYTGPAGAKEKQGTMGIENDVFVYSTDQVIYPGDGFTIALSFPTGRIAKLLPTLKEVDPATKFMNSLTRQDRINIMVGSAVAVLFYFLIIWWFKGRDPKAGTIIPQYEAPVGLSPAEVAHVYKLGLGFNETLGAGIISLAVKGKIKITKKEGFFKIGDWEIERLTKDESGLSEDEVLLLVNLFRDILHENDNAKIIVPNQDRSLAAFMNWQYKPFFTNKWSKKAYITNTVWLVLGVLLSVALLPIYLIFGSGELVISWLFMFFPALVIILVVSKAIENLTKKDFSFMVIFSAIFTLAIASFVAWVFFKPFFDSDWFGLLKTNWYVSFLVVVWLGNIFTFRFIRRPTAEGRKLLDEIEGFKLFLVATEKDRMGFFHPIDKTPEAFEKYFPYAIALGVADKWTERFKDLFVPDASGHSAYVPIWYGGALSNMSGISSISSIGSSLGSSLASSGASGGGGSGGGGGGGGGGGW
jgi:uncharacterized membrane protein YgcG